MTQRKRNVLIALAIAIIAGIPVAIWGFSSMITMAKENRAKLGVMVLEKAAMIYSIRHGYFPTHLKELGPEFDGNGGLQPEALIDPWQNPYNYDRNQLHPQTGKPLIWSDGPPGKNKAIRNWEP